MLGILYILYLMSFILLFYFILFNVYMYKQYKKNNSNFLKKCTIENDGSKINIMHRFNINPFPRREGLINLLTIYLFFSLILCIITKKYSFDFFALIILFFVLISISFVFVKYSLKIPATIFKTKLKSKEDYKVIIDKNQKTISYNNYILSSPVSDNKIKHIDFNYWLVKYLSRTNVNKYHVDIKLTFENDQFLEIFSGDSEDALILIDYIKSVESENLIFKNKLTSNFEVIKKDVEINEKTKNQEIKIMTFLLFIIFIVVFTLKVSLVFY